MRVIGFRGRRWGIIACLFALPLLFVAAAFAEDSGKRAFAIEVIDQATGRGVPLVELETVNHVTFVTDSNGLAAIDEPDLMHRNVYFTVRSHGYEFPADGFGFRGRTLTVEPGGKATIKLRRRNLAERLYRVTGAGIYRDTLLLGGQAPIKQPLLSGDVIGCDSVMTAIYRDRIYWFWGDTSRPGHPLAANFHITGATTPLPDRGGLSPSVGIDFDYLVGPDGAVRPTAKMPGDGPTWIAAVTVLPDDAGRERMYASYVKIRNQLESYRWGFVVWNDQTEQFDEVCHFDRRPPVFMEPQVHTFLLGNDDTKYVYFANPLPLTRVKANAAAFVDPSQYEGYTCLKPGTRAEDGQVQRGADGKLRYDWKTNTPPLTQKDQAMLVERGIIKADEALIALRDVESGRAVYAHSGSTYWNAYRRRWVMIAVELNGESSLLGDVWYAEADAPTGPWRYARKIVTHDRYSFYNPKHHPFFDEDGGRTIYFEGTYTHTFSGNERPTPRYDYNQMMYRLDLSQDALNLPVAFYDAAAARGEAPFVPRKPELPVAFFAKDRPGPALVPVVWDGKSLEVAAARDAAAVFYALPVDADEITGTTPLYEFVHKSSGRHVYSTRQTIDQAGYRRTEQPVCRVWK